MNHVKSANNFTISQARSVDLLPLAEKFNEAVEMDFKIMEQGCDHSLLYRYV